MITTKEKEDFLKKQFIDFLKSADHSSAPLWGKMNFQQMVEHMIDSLQIGNGKIKKTTIVTPVEFLEKAKTFMLSDKPFRENTKNVEMPEEPATLKYKDIDTAIAILENELKDFFDFFDNNPNQIVLNSIFGELKYEEWLHLLHKHSTHHLKQFGIIK